MQLVGTPPSWNCSLLSSGLAAHPQMAGAFSLTAHHGPVTLPGSASDQEVEGEAATYGGHYCHIFSAEPSLGDCPTHLPGLTSDTQLEATPPPDPSGEQESASFGKPRAVDSTYSI